MARQTSDTLLPVGHTLDHNGRSLQVMECLGSGLTGEVFRGGLASEDGGMTSVAIKAMRALEFPEARQLFLRESETLSLLMHLEEQASEAQRLGKLLKIAPHYYGRGDYQGVPYLIMEFIPGREIPDLLKADGRFGEYQALVAGWHLYRTLDVLHTGLKKTYNDLKFENLWWIPGARGEIGQLKLTDFGTLEVIENGKGEQRGVKRDLLLGGVYLCAMLTGRVVNYLLGQLLEPPHVVAQIIREAPISWGTRQLLRRLLHRNSEERPTTAENISAELRSLVGFWSAAPDKLLETAENALVRSQQETDPQGTKARDYASRARAALDIARLRLPEKADVLAVNIERAEELLQLSDYQHRGESLFKGRDYVLARQVFEKGMRWSDEPARLRRWAYLARIGQEKVPADYDDDRRAEAIAAVERLNQGDYTGAAHQLEQMLPKLASEGLEALRNDCGLFATLKRADEAFAREDFESAAQAYTAAAEFLNRLPDAKLVRDDEVGDLQTRALDVKWLAETRGAARQKIGAAAQRLASGARLKTVLSDIEEALRKDRENPEWTLALQQMVGTLLSQSRFMDAASLAQLYLRIPSKTDGMFLTYSLAAKLFEMEQALRVGSRQAFLKTGHWVRAEFWTHPQAAASVRLLFDRAAELARTQSEVLFLRDLAQFAEGPLADVGRAGQWRAIANDIEKIHMTTYASDVDRLITAASELMALDDPAHVPDVARQTTLADLLPLLRSREERLARAERMLRDAAAIAQANDQRLRVVALQARATSELKAVQEQTRLRQAMAETEQARRLNLLNDEWVRLQQYILWNQRGGEIGVSAGAREQVGHHLANQLREFMEKCQAHLVEVNAETQADHKPVTDLLSRASLELDRLGVFGWRNLQQATLERAAQLRGELSLAQAALDAGNLDEATAKLSTLLPQLGGMPEWLEVKVRLVNVQAFRAWQTEREAALCDLHLDPGLLHALRGFLALKLPEVYWIDSPAIVYLKQVREAACRTVTQALRSADEPNFVDGLRVWLEAEMTVRLAQSQFKQLWPAGKAAPQLGGHWESPAFMVAANNAAHTKEPARALGKLLARTPFPANIETALKELTPTAWVATVTTARRQRQTRRLLQIIASVLLGSFFVAGIGAGSTWLFAPKAVAQIISGTYTSTPTNTSTPTVTLTPTPTSSLTPTPTPTLTPIPASAFLESDPAKFDPLLPSADAVWVMSEDHAVAEPPFTDKKMWKPGESSKGGKFFYTESGGASVTWTLDTTLYAGLYQIYVLDTQYRSAGEQEFSVMLDGAPATPYRGQSTVIFNANAFDQLADDWLSLGAYKVGDGQWLSVKATIGPRTNLIPFAVDQLVILKVSEPQRHILDLLPTGRVLVSLLDDDRAMSNVFTPLSRFQYVAVNDPLAWNGVFYTKKDGPAQVDWTPIGRLPAGKYELHVWVPAQHATAEVTFSLLADGKLVARDTPAQLNQAAFHGEWVSMDPWELKTEAAVTVRMNVAADVKGEVGVDAVALVRVGN